jgi:ATP-binding cassette subfamily F protein 3
MEALSTKTLELTPGEHKLFYGNYAYYIDKHEREYELEPKEEHRGENKASTSTQMKDADKKIDMNFGAAEFREAEKKKQAQKRKLLREEEQILQELETLEHEKQKLTAEIQKPEVYSNGEKAKLVQIQLDDVNAKIDMTSEKWEAIAADLDKVGI